MIMRLAFVLLASLAFAAPSFVLADGGQKTETSMSAVRPAQVCPASTLERKLNLAQTSPAECCKEHKGVCGCRAGKIICCDGTASTQPGCTCHGDDGFLE